jgi:hypothetical protein
MKKLIFSNDGTIRGSFVNLIITCSILGVLMYGLLFSQEIVMRIKMLDTFIVGFFTASFGIWAAKNVLESKKDD